MPIFVNDNGTWKETSEHWVNDNGTWKRIYHRWVNDNGTWKRVTNDYTLFTETYSDGSQQHIWVTFDTPKSFPGLTKENGSLRFDVWINDVNNVDTSHSAQLEITSSGTYDNEEWHLDDWYTYAESGVWKTVEVDLLNFNTDGGELDVENVNYIRIYCFGVYTDFEFRNMYFVY